MGLRYLSIFSGIEAATVAWGPLGWEPVAFCEIDEFPSAVLRARFPQVPNLGDITKVDWSPYRGAIDVVVGGSPCQSFSIAGRREGLAGASGLMWEYIRCVQDVMPEWLVWKNVPGALSVERGWAFEQLLSSLDDLGYGLAWRVLDAQFFGVAQRRRRVFLVGHLGDMRACEALFEPESLRWDTPSSREKRETLARAARRGAGGGGFKFHQGSGVGNIGYEQEQSPTLTTDWHQPAVTFWDIVKEATEAYRTRPLPCPICGEDATVDICDPQEPESFWLYSCGCPHLGCDNYVRLRKGWRDKNDAIGNWNGHVLVTSPSYTIDYKQTPKVNEDVCHTLTHEGEGGIHSAVAFAQNTRNEVRLQGGDESRCGTVEAQPGKNQSYVLCRASDHVNAETCEDMAPALLSRASKSAPFVLDRASYSQGARAQYAPHVERTELCDTIIASGPHAVSYGCDLRSPQLNPETSGTLATKANSLNHTAPVLVEEDGTDGRAVTISDGTSWVVRRLTPTECERLQGFPDGWTDIGEWTDGRGRRRKTTDGNRYKALGNSFAVPVVRWIGERIGEVERKGTK